jgi:inner membrane protein
MDPITHGLVGSAAAQSLAEKKNMRPAAFTGFISAMLADLDYFIHLPSDPLFNSEIHRHFTHSLIFIPAGALVAAGLLWWVMRRHFTFRKLYLFSLVSYGTAGILDAFTSYGTMLLWPFLDTRFAWNMISVVDPLFSIIFAFLVFGAVFYRHKPYTWFAWAWLILYLTFGFIQRERATAAAIEVAQERGHQVQKMDVKPTIGNLLLWRNTYESDDIFYTDGIRLRFFDSPKIYPGESAQRVYPEETYDDYMATIQYYDIMRFDRLSEGYLIRHPEKPDVLGDARYSMLPVSMVPLWGIRVDMSRPDEHVTFHYFRDASPEVREQFWRMFLARD